MGEKKVAAAQKAVVELRVAVEPRKKTAQKVVVGPKVVVEPKVAAAKNSHQDLGQN